MIAWLRRVFGGCRHQWETLNVVGIEGRHGEGTIGKKFYLRCTKCGWVRQRRLTN